MRTVLAPLVLIPFTVFTCWVLADVGYIGLVLSMVEDGPSQQVALDLVIACTMLLGFLRRDAAQRGMVFWPWVLATAALGSIAPLVYLTYTGWRGEPLTRGDANDGTVPVPVRYG